jgi:hypothetical protein
MSEKKSNECLVQTKLGLAAKYERLARTCKSRHRRKTLLRHAGSYRQQAADVGRRLK